MKNVIARQRRQLIKALACLPLCWSFPTLGNLQSQQLTKLIPGTKESLPQIGMGSWLTFNVGNNNSLRQARAQVLNAFFQQGGKLIDSSPMYGSSEAVIGYCLQQQTPTPELFSASKTWTSHPEQTLSQFKHSLSLWTQQHFDLLQIHNLRAWQHHLPKLQQLKAQGKIRYIGITTSHGRRHNEMEKIMQHQPIDFVQFSYNMSNRDVEQRLLPLAIEKGLAVIINRPLDGGKLMQRFEHKPLPAWAKEFDCFNWAQFFLKFVISHPAVTCAIPATSQVAHMRENMGASYGRLPTPELRQKMFSYLDSV